VEEVTIIHRTGKESSNPDALSPNLLNPFLPEGIGEMQIAVGLQLRQLVQKWLICCHKDLKSDQPTDYASEQWKDPDVVKIIRYGILPSIVKPRNSHSKVVNLYLLTIHILYALVPVQNISVYISFTVHISH